jgi:hypothetical protein
VTEIETETHLDLELHGECEQMTTMSEHEMTDVTTTGDEIEVEAVNTVQQLSPSHRLIIVQRS